MGGRAARAGRRCLRNEGSARRSDDHLARRLDTDRTIPLGRLDPFLLRGVHFSAGGFGAVYGFALSIVADLRTVDRPQANELDFTDPLSGPPASRLGRVLRRSRDRDLHQPGSSHARIEDGRGLRRL